MCAVAAICIAFSAGPAAATAPVACLAHPKKGALRRFEDYLNNYFQQHPIRYQGHPVSVSITSCHFSDRRGNGWRLLRCTAETSVGLTYLITLSFGFRPACTTVTTWRLLP